MLFKSILIIYIQLFYSALELAFRKHSCTVRFLHKVNIWAKEI